MPAFGVVRMLLLSQSPVGYQLISYCGHTGRVSKACIKVEWIRAQFEVQVDLPFSGSLARLEAAEFGQASWSLEAAEFVLFNGKGINGCDSPFEIST